MIPNKYRASSVAERFWLLEFKKVNGLVENDFSYEALKEKQDNENFLLSNSDSYGKRTINTVIRRHSKLPKDILNAFNDFDIENQKYINLISIMLTDRLLFEYIYEVYRPSITEEIFEISLKNDNIFLTHKSEESEHINKLTDQTKKRLLSSYKNYLIEAGVIYKKDKLYVSNKIYLDERLVELLNANKMDYILKAFVEDKSIYG